MEALLYGCMTWAPRREHYRLLRRTHHRLLLRVIGYRRERGTYRQLSYAQALKKTGCQSVEATIRQRRLLFAGAMVRQPAGRLPKRLMEAFGATDGSTVDNRLIFGVDRAVWTLAAKMDDGAPWHKGVLRGAEKFNKPSPSSPEPTSDSGSVHESQRRQLRLSLHRSHRNTYCVCFCFRVFYNFRGEKRRSLC